MPTLRPLPFVALLCTLAGGCAASGSFPSLAPRPEELNRNQPAAPAPPPPVAVLDPAVTARIDILLADARRGDAAFRAALPEVETVVARSGAAGSDSWAEAQQAVSRLEAARSPTTLAASEMDALFRARIEAAPSAAEPDLGAIGAAIEQIRTLAEDQNQTIGRLSGALAAP